MNCPECKRDMRSHKLDCSYNHARIYCSWCEEHVSRPKYHPYCSEHCQQKGINAL